MEEKKIFCADCGCLIDHGDEIEIYGDYYCRDCAEDNWRICDACGRLVRAGDTVLCDGDELCQSCADDLVIWCEHCNEYHYAEDSRQVYRPDDYRRQHGEIWCEDCVNRDAIQCYDCGEYFNGNLIPVRGGNVVCDRCIEDYYYCEHCEEYVHYSEWNSEEEACCDCAECTGVKAYHDAPPIKYIGACRRAWRGIWRGIGIELEIDREDIDKNIERETVQRLKSIAGEALYFERDGSLNNGFEIITQPHTEDAFRLIAWDKILNTCREKGYVSHNAGNCGLHLHLSREIFGASRDLQGVAISKLIYFYDLFYTEILKISRRTRGEADRWAAKYYLKDRKEAEAIGKRKTYRGRYFAINNSNRNTVEIRITRGTLNYNTFMACIDFMLTAAKNSRRIAWRNVRNPQEWLKGLQPASLEYLKKCNAFSEVV